MVQVMASIVVRPERAEAARALLAEVAAASPRERGAGMFAAPPKVVGCAEVDAP